MRYLLFASIIFCVTLITSVATTSATRSDEPVSFIYYLTNENGRLNVFRMNMDGTDKRAITGLTHDDFYTTNYRPSPNGQWIAYMTNMPRSNPNPDDIYVRHTTTLKTINITNTPDDREFIYDWSPDGRFILYKILLNDEQSQLAMIDTQTKDFTVYNDMLPEDIVVLDAKWSPDGQWILVVGESFLHLAQVDVWDWRTIDVGEQLHRSPSWSPYSDAIVFTAEKRARGFNSGLYLYELASDESTFLTNEYDINTRPSWTADGEWIVFVSDRLTSEEILRIRPDGTELVCISQSQFSFDSFPVPATVNDHTWVLFESDREGRGTNHLYRMNLDGSDVRRLTFNDAFNTGVLVAPIADFAWNPLWLGLGAILVIGFAVWALISDQYQSSAENVSE